MPKVVLTVGQLRELLATLDASEIVIVQGGHLNKGVFVERRRPYGQGAFCQKSAIVISDGLLK